MTELRRVLLVFVDGVGIGPADPRRNPFLSARISTLRRLAGGLPVAPPDGPPPPGPAGGVVPLDARLGVAGTPASGTGHVAVLTGRDAPALHGGHFGPWVPVALRPLVQEESLLRRARARGLEVRFANAYPRELARGAPPRFETGMTLAARGAGLLDRHAEHLRRGEAVASQIVHEVWQAHLARAGEGRGEPPLPPVTPEAAGERLARLAAGAHLTLFAHYETDRAGHRGGMEGARRALERLDRFLAGVVDALPPDALLAVVSDHGNLEDVKAGHTTNPALGLLHGPGARPLLERMERITDVAGGLLESLEGVSATAGERGSGMD